uniref:Putative lipocalin-5 1 n=1 Tax=Amblyomma tuberculatum TaxID=48802 RepID=A0A6M2E6L6_9ACAR
MVWLKAGVCLLLFALADAGPTRNSRHDSTDYAKISSVLSTQLYAAFPRPVAIFTSSNHASFKCLSATRTAFDPNVKSATYVWHFKPHSGHKGKDVRLNFFPGDTPGQKFYLNDDKAREFTVLFEYTDYKACAVVKLPYENS